MKPPQPEQVPREPSRRGEGGDGDTAQLEQIGRVGVHAPPHDDARLVARIAREVQRLPGVLPVGVDRKSTRLNSSHSSISYAVFCLKKKKKTILLQSVINVEKVWSKEMRLTNE